MWSEEAWEDYLYWQDKDKKTVQKINELIKDISRTPFEGKGKPESLKHNLAGFGRAGSRQNIDLFTL